MNRDGTLLKLEGGEPDTGAAPPFLLRYSPRLFAKEAPEMFVWDETTNALSLKPGREPPWLRQYVGGVPTDSLTWLYCPECRDRYCAAETGQRTRSYIPYRDSASRFCCKPFRRIDEAASQDEMNAIRHTQPEPEEEPPEDEEACLDEPSGEDPDDIDEDAINAVDLPLRRETQAVEEADVPPPPVPREPPSLAEYMERWEAKKRFHARPQQRSKFTWKNLVPKPVTQLWQDCKGLSILVYCTRASCLFAW